MGPASVHTSPVHFFCLLCQYFTVFCKGHHDFQVFYHLYKSERESISRLNVFSPNLSASLPCKHRQQSELESRTVGSGPFLFHVELYVSVWPWWEPVSAHQNDEQMAGPQHSLLWGAPYSLCHPGVSEKGERQDAARGTC